MRLALAILLGLVAAQDSVGRTWHVEKDGSGDFTVIQDALDAAASGDTVLVGPGRFEDFRPGQSTVDGFPFQMIAWIYTGSLTLIGSGAEQTILGPATFTDEVDGRPAGSLYVDGGSLATVRGFTIENTLGRVTIRRKTTLSDCVIKKEDASDFFALAILESDGSEIRGCEFYGPSSIITSSPAVTNPRIIDCTFSDPTQSDFAIVVGNGATGALISQCTIDGHGIGFQTSFGGTATLEDCRFVNVRSGSIDLSSGSIVMRRCRIEAGNRFPIRAAQGSIEIYDSHIGGGTEATILAWNGVYMRNSNILNGGGLTVDARGTGIQVSDLRENWWGTTDLEQIESWISQPNDNVLYEPVLDSSIPTQAESLSSLKARFVPK